MGTAGGRPWEETVGPVFVVFQSCLPPKSCSQMNLAVACGLWEALT